MRDVRSRVVGHMRGRVASFLAGMDAGDWLRLLRENEFAIDPPYWPRAAYITAGVLRTAAFRAREERRYGPAIAATDIEPPLFILGFWRSGTTHLQRLLAQDDRFAYPTAYQVSRPHIFLSTTGRRRRPAFWQLTTRPIDSMPVGPDLPEEDEPALAVLSRCSWRLGRVFPRHRDRYDRFLTFREAAPEEVARWQAALLWFLKKLTWRSRRPLVLKSPLHMARVGLLLELFPDARFLHIHRHPYAVFQSACHTDQSLRHHQTLQRDTTEDLEDRVIGRYREVYDAFFDQRSRVPDRQLHEVRFEAIERDPVGTLREGYRNLGLSWSGDLEAKLGRYLGSIRGYRRNAYPALDAAVRRHLAESWSRSFEELGYRP